MKAWGVIIESLIFIASGGLITKTILQAYIRSKKNKDDDQI